MLENQGLKTLDPERQMVVCLRQEYIDNAGEIMVLRCDVVDRATLALDHVKC